ncbi:polymer-forming cytoskeletal protein [Rivularia sp. UHCC 0363]|uniref:polymer-forming cytoskeletal protein n=1 Tax=Rivularia sp. UHCC 0363 TaxID=3110244 RepID=UPI002B1F0C54|nr:polymer-forming cytoskeletal protein [Rivularia sp. UHCC 0363]MEA5597907.1 polymer-forming cytoskeletal protein [Rivularia sp. UHCC 0363]
MKYLRRKWLTLALISILSAILFSTMAIAQTDIDINNDNIIRVGGDVTVAANKVVENAQAIGGDVTIEEGARVRQTAIAIDGDVILQKNARVDGDAYAVGGKVITEQGAIIAGSSGTLSGWGVYGAKRRGINSFLVRYFFGSAFHIFKIIVGAIVGILIIKWRPNFLPNLANTLNQYPLQSGLWGLGGLISIIVVIILLTVTLIGIPLLPLVGLMTYVAVILGTLGVALWLGEKSMKEREKSPTQQFIAGMLILALIGLIPLLGGLMMSVVNIFGFGALLFWLLDNHRDTRVLG